MLGVEDTDHVNKAFAAFGLQPDQPLEPEVISIWPDNFAAVQAAQRLLGQYLLAPSGWCFGFRIEAIEVVMRTMQTPRTQRLATMDDLIFMGREIAHHLNAQLA